MPQSTEIRISLNEQRFRKLVRGEVLTIVQQNPPDVQISLADIGWNVLIEVIIDAHVDAIRKRDPSRKSDA